MMTSDGRVQRGCSLSFDASPPDVLLSSIWTGGDPRVPEGLEETDGIQRGQSMLISD